MPFCSLLLLFCFTTKVLFSSTFFLFCSVFLCRLFLSYIINLRFSSHAQYHCLHIFFASSPFQHERKKKPNTSNDNTDFACLWNATIAVVVVRCNQQAGKKNSSCVCVCPRPFEESRRKTARKKDRMVLQDLGRILVASM